ncbi:hypothetical protein [Stenomitos frigidus]|uniref:hypothetical protein n=1 Tax=Stenomitos frigidus TaxID=1886765 RepID=UPI0011B1DA59|nr:hypothetical protein [Stenomitos frigidus]
MLNPKCLPISRFKAWERSRTLQQQAPCRDFRSAMVGECNGKEGLISGAIVQNDQQTSRNNQSFIKNSDNLPNGFLS